MAKLVASSRNYPSNTLVVYEQPRISIDFATHNLIDAIFSRPNARDAVSRLQFKGHRYFYTPSEKYEKASKLIRAKFGK